MELEFFDNARNHIQQIGFTPEIQTKISLLLTAAKNGNALFLGAVEFRPFLALEQQFLHAQYFQEMESVLLLTKVTKWVPSPTVYSEALSISAPIVNEWREIGGFFGMGYLNNPTAFYRGLALGHALLSQLRISPIIPADANPLDPYVAALNRIEQDNARMIQTQINLLRTISPELSADAREALIESEQETVRQTFIRFLEWIAQSKEESPAA